MAISTLKNPDRRVCERVEYKRAVVIRLGENHWVNGQTLDISLSGANVAIEDEISHKWLKQAVSLFILDSNGDRSPEFPCTIARIDAQSLCLQLGRKTASKFGVMLTRRIFKRKTSVSTDG